MPRLRSQAEIVRSLLNFYQLAQPNLDLKPGQAERDLFIEGPSSEEAKLYNELNQVANAQSLKFNFGKDLENLVSNFDKFKNKGSFSTGQALCTFKTLDSDVAINKGDLINAKNGSTFTVTSSIVVNSLFASRYRAIASQFQADLDFLGIKDQFAVLVPVQASAPGEQGNIDKYSLISTQIAGVSHVTNTQSVGGGLPPQDDNSLRTEALAVFSGSNTGTDLGYQNAIQQVPAVTDVIVIKSGDPLMLRDGTKVVNGQIIIEGTGGKVDIYVFGFSVQETFDSYIYQDRSNTNDPTNVLNDRVLGQIPGDENKNINRRRVENLTDGVLPSQPVNNLIDVTGTSSGSNFQQEVIDDLGRSSGNFKLVKDTGVFKGSPFGFDKLHWIDNKISNFQEDKTKSSFNSQDSFNFTDVLSVNSVQQNLTINNENPIISSSDRSILQLRHFPLTNITRVLNTTTGELYIITSANLDGAGTINNTGRVKISGKTLPAVTDILQVDYTWIYFFDPDFDFDNLVNTNNPRTVSDSLDWGFSNRIIREQVTLQMSGSYLSAIVSHPIDTVINLYKFLSENQQVVLNNNRLSIVVTQTVASIISIVRTSDNLELFNTTLSNGTFSNKIVYFPTDSLVVFGNNVKIVYNPTQLFNSTTSSFSGNVINLTFDASLVGILVEVNYLANITQLLPSINLTELPAIRNFNNFDCNTLKSIGFEPTTHIYDANKNIISNLRLAPSFLFFNLSGNFSPGVLTILGSTIFRVADAVFTVTTNGLKLDLTSAIKKFLKLESVQSLPSNLQVIRLSRVEKVNADVNFNVLSSIYTYDLLGYQIKNNQFDISRSLSNSILTNTEVTLPNNQANSTQLFQIGDRVRVTFDYSISTDSESISFVQAGTQISGKKYLLVQSITVSSGFLNGTVNLSVDIFNQPLSRSRYRSFYNYLAPKPNERITIRYNYNKLVTDSTLAAENARNIDADVLVKESEAILVSSTLNIIVTTEFNNNLISVQQNVKDAIINKINTKIKQTAPQLDRSDLVQTAYQVSGVDRAEVFYFNKSGVTGSVLTITGQKNQYLIADNIVINVSIRT